MAQEHQEYIQQKVNPILENLVTQLLLERPEHLAPYMIKWLSENVKTPAAAALTEGVNELSVLKAELEKLQEEVKKLEAETGSAGDSGKPAEGEKDKEKEETESEEEDDDDDVDLAPPPAAYLKKERTSVSAEAYGAFNVKKAFTPPVYPKTDDQKDRIKAVLLKSFLFKNLEEADLQTIIGAMQEKVCSNGERLIEQGDEDNADCMFVVETGTMNCFKKLGEEEKLVKVCEEGAAFGELALLYNCPRAASVVAAKDKNVLWRLDRETFNHIVRDAAQKRRERYEAFLKKVPVLDTLEQYERLQMCDALQSETFSAGTKIVQQGDPGDKFYILEDGEAVAEKAYTKDAPPQEVLNYKPGDYFGELALLNNETRAATVLAKTECKVCSLTGGVFKTLLGPLEEILKRKSADYK
jgi:cAMP-dependent protein kinase regulator